MSTLNTLIAVEEGLPQVGNVFVLKGVAVGNRFEALIEIAHCLHSKVLFQQVARLAEFAANAKCPLDSTQVLLHEVFAAERAENVVGLELRAGNLVEHIPEIQDPINGVVWIDVGESSLEVHHIQNLFFALETNQWLSLIPQIWSLNPVIRLHHAPQTQVAILPSQR